MRQDDAAFHGSGSQLAGLEQRKKPRYVVTRQDVARLKRLDQSGKQRGQGLKFKRIALKLDLIASKGDARRKRVFDQMKKFILAPNEGSR